MHARFLFLFLISFSVSAQQTGSDLVSTLRPVEVASGFDSVTSIVHAGDGSRRLFLTERAGRIWILDRNLQRVEGPFLDIRARVGDAANEEGLLDLAFHPEFSSNGRFFVNYTTEQNITVVSQFVVSGDPNRADPESEEVYLTVDQPYDNHNGGQIQFGPDGMLYVAMGDGGSGGDPHENGQALSSPLGNLLRLDVNQGAPARAPADNPYAGVADAYEGVWALGLRNPWRFSFDRATGDLWITDVGENAWEEINFVPAGEGAGFNFGWRLMEGGHCFIPGEGCNDGSVILPVIEYPHEGRACSVIGGYRYRGARYAELQGVYFYADFCSWMLYGAVESSPGVFEVSEPLDVGGSISTFGEDEAGELYFANYYDGRIFRLDAPPRPPRISQGGVVNAASFAAGQPVVAGSVISVFGLGLAAAAAEASQTPLPAELGGSRFDIGAVAAPAFFVSPGQVNLQVPWELGGSANAQLTAFLGELASDAMTVPLAAVQPAVFTMNASGGGQATALIAGTGLLAAPDGYLRGSRPIRAGESLEIFATGLGPVTNTPATGAASPLAPLAYTQVEVLVRFGAGEAVPATFAGLAPGFVGLYQVNVEIPSDAPSGVDIPLTLLAGGNVSNTVTVAIE